MEHRPHSAQRASFIYDLLFDSDSDDSDNDSDSEFHSDGRRKCSRWFRHGGFHRQPRNPARRRMDIRRAQDKWRHPCQDEKFGSKWWAYFINNPDTFDDESADGLDFQSNFVVPRLLYEDLYDSIRHLPQFRDVVNGDGKKRGCPALAPTPLTRPRGSGRCRGRFANSDGEDDADHDGYEAYGREDDDDEDL